MTASNSFLTSRRGLAVGIMVFVAIVVTTALIYIMLNPAVEDIENKMLDQSNDPETSDMVSQRATIFYRIPVYGLFVAGMFLIVRAVFESRRPG